MISWRERRGLAFGCCVVAAGGMVTTYHDLLHQVASRGLKISGRSVPSHEFLLVLFSLSGVFALVALAMTWQTKGWPGRLVRLFAASLCGVWLELAISLPIVFHIAESLAHPN